MSKYKVLIVDDDKVALLVIEEILSGAGYEIFKAGNGKEAVEQTKKLLPDIIVMDIMMPELDGISAVLKLKTAKETGAIPIIVCTSVKEGEDEVLARNLGVADYIRKTPQMEGLLGKVERILNK